MYEGIAVDSNVTARRIRIATDSQRTGCELAKLAGKDPQPKVPEGALIREVCQYQDMPTIKPQEGQIHFFSDGIEAVVSMLGVDIQGGSVTRRAPNDKVIYRCMLVDEGRKEVVEFSYIDSDLK